ncbi:MAG: nuclear transport factor 2 family protein [Gaiellaceae bacterium]
MTIAVQEWLDRYRHAWETANADAVVELFTDDASYRSSIFAEAHVGRDAIRAYWKRATATQKAVVVQIGRPFVDADRVAAEWWTTMEDEGEEVTLPGCLLLRFDANGRCRELREYWQVEQARLAPPDDWGT